MSAGLQGYTQTYDQPWFDQTGLIKEFVTLDSTVVDSRNSEDTSRLRAGLVLVEKSGDYSYVNTDSADAKSNTAASIQSTAYAAGWSGETLTLSDSEGDTIGVALGATSDENDVITALEASAAFAAKYSVAATGTNQITITALNETASFNASISNVADAFSTNEAVPTEAKYVVVYDGNVQMRGPVGSVQDTESQVVSGGGVAETSRLSGLTALARAYLSKNKMAFRG